MKTFIAPLAIALMASGTIAQADNLTEQTVANDGVLVKEQVALLPELTGPASSIDILAFAIFGLLVGIASQSDGESYTPPIPD